MKIKLLFLCFALMPGFAFARGIAENDALDIGRNFLLQGAGSNALAKTSHASIASSLRLVYTEHSLIHGTAKASQPAALYYVLSASAHGFVIVAGDDKLAPILGYSDETEFDPARLPPNVAKWLEGYKTQIRHVLATPAPIAQGIAAQWNGLRAGPLAKRAARSAGNVNPLVQTKWNQTEFYNQYSPQLTPTGCVATAMAQIMKFWSYPAQGAGFHSYNHPVYGTLSANFGNTVYAWASMPNVVTGPNTAVATLMYDAGVSVDMIYAPHSSNAYITTADNPVSAETALKTYFSYPTTVRGLERKLYSDAQWTGALKSELDAGRPILYAGFGTGGGHAFVCDGYDANAFFHFNWGWGGEYDGYFSVDNLDPAGVGTGGGSGVYNSGHEAIVGIQPPATTLTTGLALYADVAPSAATIYYEQAFSVSTNVINNGSGPFTGDFCAAIFDDSLNFIDYLETKTGYSLAPGNALNANLVFSTIGLYSLLPQRGSTIGIYYRPTGGEWVAVAGAGGHSNFIHIDVVNPGRMEMYSAMSLTPGKVFTRGDPASITLNLQNTGTTTFTGQYQVNLYNLDGSGVETIGAVNDDVGLDPTFVYGPPYLNFSSTAITAAPGTYLLAVLYKEAASTTWAIVGSTNYRNPMKIIVQQAALQADIYEPNDNLAQARNLPVTFAGNTASILAAGANCHSETDIDYYKIKLPPGTNYRIGALLRDAYDPDPANTHTLDGVVSYSTDSSTWSDAFDDVMPDSIDLPKGGTVFFHVAPHFAGGTGTYALELNISKNGLSGIVDPILVGIFSVYPSPARDFVSVNRIGSLPRIDKVEILDMLGKTGFSETYPGDEKLIRIPLGGMSEGQYYLQVHADGKTFTRKIRIAK